MNDVYIPTVLFLKDLIDDNGPDYIWTNPYEVYEEALKSKISHQDARLLLYVLANGTDLRDYVKKASGDVPKVSQELRRRCLLQKPATDGLAEIFTTLYSNKNIEAWRKVEEEGYNKFCSGCWTFEWNGESKWKSSNVYVECESSATATVEIINKEKVRKTISGMLKLNSFVSEDEIADFFNNKLCDQLDSDFDYYCTCEEYYPPVAEDYASNYAEEVKSFCKSNGFKLLDYTYEGRTGDYESDDYYDRY